MWIQLLWSQSGNDNSNNLAWRREDKYCFQDLTQLLLFLGLAAAAGAAGYFFGQNQNGRSFPLLSPAITEEEPGDTILRGEILD